VPYLIKAVDTSGAIALRRDTPQAALKKARELLADGCLDIEIVGPDGHSYPASAFDQLGASAPVH
jgi:hypothetical protein